MKLALLAFALLQSSGAAPLLAARTACFQHEAQAAHHAGHEGPAAPAHGTGQHADCNHCPPADCARHVTCGTLSVAVLPDPVAPSLAPLVTGTLPTEGRLARGQPPAPPLTPPRLIA